MVAAGVSRLIGADCSVRIVAGNWIFDSRNATWDRAANVPELQMFFQARPHFPPTEVEVAGAAGAIDLRVLRRIKLLSYFSDEQLERFTQFVVAEQMPMGAVVVKQGDCGNAMYVILEGELSVRLNVGGLETGLATLRMGDFFGDFALFDHGPRSASVVATMSCLLLKISVEAFESMSQEAADLSTPILRAIAKTFAARIRASNKHHGEAVKFSRALRKLWICPAGKRGDSAIGAIHHSTVSASRNGAHGVSVET